MEESSRTLLVRHLPIIVHNRDEQAHLIHVFWRDVKDDGLVVDGIEGVLFDGCFLLLQPPPVTQQGYFDVGICAREGSARISCVKQTVVVLFVCFWTRILLGRPGWPQTHNCAPASTFPSAEATGASHH